MGGAGVEVDEAQLVQPRGQLAVVRGEAERLTVGVDRGGVRRAQAHARGARLSNGGAARATFAGVDGRGAIAGVGDELTDDCAVVRAIGEGGVTVAVVHRSHRGELVERARVIPLGATPEGP